MKHDPEALSRPNRFDPVVVLAGLLGVSLIWFYWPAFLVMNKRWSTDPRYAHGYLVPVFALVVLWLRRDRLATLTVRSNWRGLVLIGIALALRLIGAYLFVGWLEAASLLPALGGLCVLVRGWPSLRWAWPAIAFLVFMVPLPYRLEGALASPLQRVATNVSTYALQTLDFPALAEGNVIYLERGELGVVEACSGLSMLFTFFAMAFGMVLVIRRPWLDKVAIVASAIPIALIVNTIRITVTGVLHEMVGSEAANLVFHDLAGWLMMPMAMGLLWIELKLLSRLFVEPTPASTVLSPLDLTRAAQDARDHRDPADADRRTGKKDALAALKGLLTNT
ncbi:eight transmembrane protein EpsH, putative exosortase [Singulisphaera acidiphila DSM 18658]|uniref:Eight transmembrane protein EpsH, putative exosortase n=2 Tax=Singulisphaera acidiphila TaxID=466153 RepID=L0DD86_SINAD|nr:eight transmembrane protein EpsH, putative exosortase [Singulisphaera acidiphila DSM 18658]